jgi:hypothetical protein
MHGEWRLAGQKKESRLLKSILVIFIGIVIGILSTIGGW